MKPVLPTFIFARSNSVLHFTMVVDPIRYFGWITRISVEILPDYGYPSVGTGKDAIRIHIPHNKDFPYWDLVTDFIYYRCSEQRPLDASVEVARGILWACDEYMIRHIHSQ